jgi:hypothetical protein
MATATPAVRNPKDHHKKFPCYVGFYVTRAQREKLDSIVRETHRGLGETMRLLLDHAQIHVRELDLRVPAQITLNDAPEA